MWETLITKINATLAEVSQVKDYFATPKTKLTKFPAVFFKPSGFTNAYETQSENMAVYQFTMVVMVAATQITPEEAFQNVLPHTVDAILEQFDADWDKGTVDGHRVTLIIESADEWQMSEEQDGLIAYAPFTIQVRLLTNV